MSYLAAMFLLYMDEFDAFQCMCGLFQRKIFTAFYTMELESVCQKKRYLAIRLLF